MAPGTWKLTAVSIGKTTSTSVAIPDNVTFKVLPPNPVVVHIEFPKSVRAGEQFVLKASFEKIPKSSFPECELLLIESIHHVWPDGRNQGSYDVGLQPPVLTPDQLSYTMSTLLPPDYPAGTLEGTLEIVASNTLHRHVPFCLTPPHVIRLEKFTLACFVLALSTLMPVANAGTCPAFGADTDCGVIITITDTGATVSFTGQGPYDSVEDTLVGVVNNSKLPIRSIVVTSGQPVFAFDGDGIDTYGAPGNPMDSTGYGGQTVISRGSTRHRHQEP
jgi:hypothetical protein